MKGRWGKDGPAILVLKLAVSSLIALQMVAIPPATGAQSSKEAETIGWVNEHYEQVVDQLFPEVPKVGKDGHAHQAQWILSVRVYDPQRPDEYWFSIRKNYDRPIEATIRVPEGKPVYTQLGELWQAAPANSPESIAQRVRLKEYSWTSDKVPELEKLVKEFEGVKVGAEPSEVLWSDPVVYHFWTRSRSGDEMRVTLNGPEPWTPRRLNPLIRFVEDFRKFMDRQIQIETAKR